MVPTPRRTEPSDDDLDVDALSGALTDAEYDDAHDIDAFSTVDDVAVTTSGSPDRTPADVGEGDPDVDVTPSDGPAAGLEDTSARTPLEADPPKAAPAAGEPTKGSTTPEAKSGAGAEPTGEDTMPRTVAVSRRRRLLVRSVIAVLLVAAVVGGVLAGVWGTSLHDRDQVADAAKAAQDTARTYAVTLTSIDSATIDQNFQQVLDGATGSFKDMYSKSSDQLKTLLVQNKATSKGQVLDSAVQSASKDRVVVLLFVDQSVTNNQSPDPRVDRSRITMTMNRVGERWLASQVDLK